MSPHDAHTVLVLGGIKSGKSEFAELLAAGDAATVRYVATSPLPDDSTGDTDWAARIDAHRRRRPAHWTTEDIGAVPDRLAAVIGDADAGTTVLVDDLGGWFTALLRHTASPSAESSAAGGTSDGEADWTPPNIDAATSDVISAIEAAAARVIVVSPEVGLSLVPTTPAGRWFADAVGAANRRLAAAVDATAFVVAGRAVWLPSQSDEAATVSATTTAAVAARSTKARAKAKAGTVTDTALDRDVAPTATIQLVPRAVRSRMDAAAVFAAAEPEAASERPTEPDDEIRIGMSIPVPDAAAATSAEERIQRLPVAGPGIGGLTPFAKFAAAAQGDDHPQPFRSIRVIAVTGSHQGDVGAGGTVPGWAHPDTADASALAQLAAATPDVTIELLDAGVAEPIESGDVMTNDELAAALRHGWNRAQAAADRGDDVIVLAAGGPGVDAAAAAVLAGITRAEVPSLLPRVFGPSGYIDDAAWMTRCVAIRDAIAKLRTRVHDGPTSLVAVGGPIIATATGLLLGAARRRTPVIIDGPVGAAAALAARDYAAQVRLWCLLTDVAGDPAVQFAADRLGLEPAVSIGLGLGEGANALALLPTLQSALVAAGLADDPLAEKPTGDEQLADGEPVAQE